MERTVLDARDRTPSQGRVVVGREGPLATIREGLDDPVAGRVVLVAGEAGIGKSTLLGAAAREARRRGARVGRGLWEHDQAPFAAWVEALHGVGVEPPALRDPAPGRTLRRRLALAADEAQVLVTLDDAHRADGASLDVLRALGRVGVPPGVVVLVAAREPDAVAHPAWSDASADLAPLDGVERTVLRELDEAGTRALVGNELGDTLAGTLWARTGGHPLHLSALLAEISGLPDDEARVAATAQVPERLRPLLAHQLAQLPEACRLGLEALAVLGAIPLADLAAAAGVPARRLAADLRPAATLTLVEATADGFAFRHELTAAAVLDTVPAVVAAQLHLARYELLPAGAPPFTVLRHVLGAAALLPAATVADAHLPAIATAYRNGALAEAERLLDAARDHTTRPCEVALLRGLVLEARGRVDEAAEEFDAVVVDPRAEVAEAVAAAMGDDAQGPSVAGRPRRLERLRRVRELSLDDRQRARVLRGMITEEQQLVGVTETPSLVAELMAIGDTGADPHVAAEVAVATAFLQLDAAVSAAERVDTCRRARELADAAGELTLRFEADELLVAALVAAGRVEEALARHAELAPEAEQRHRPRTMWATRLLDASMLLAIGKVADADEAAQDAFTRGQELGIPDALGAFGVHLITRHLLTGDMPVLGGLPATAAGMYPRVVGLACLRGRRRRPRRGRLDRPDPPGRVPRAARRTRGRAVRPQRALPRRLRRVRGGRRDDGPTGARCPAGRPGSHHRRRDRRRGVRSARSLPRARAVRPGRHRRRRPALPELGGDGGRPRLDPLGGRRGDARPHPRGQRRTGPGAAPRHAGTGPAAGTPTGALSAPPALPSSTD